MAESARHVVLIHGAWAGSWVWDSLLPGLLAAGLTPHAIDLPGNGRDGTPAESVTLERYVEHVETLLASLEGPIHLVAHSGGGLTATAVAERQAERIASVSYVAGMMLPNGTRFADLCAELRPGFAEVAGVGPWLEHDGTSSRVPPEAAALLFFHDAQIAQAIAAARRLVPQPDGGRAAATRWTAARFGRLPRLYVECSDDRSVVPILQQQMQLRVPGAERAVLACGHVPQLAMPERLLAELLAFFARHRGFAF